MSGPSNTTGETGRRNNEDPPGFGRVGSGVGVEMAAISKSYFGAQALSEVSLEIRPGSFHALVGENGAGKSTLGKIVAGMIRPDGGEFSVNRARTHFRSPRDAIAAGITTVQQELSIVPELSVADNVLLGRPEARFGFVSRHAQRARCAKLLGDLNYDLDPGAQAGSLGLAAKRRIEIARAVARDASLIVVDEPTAALTRREADHLLDLLTELNGRGTTIVYVSHFLEEVLDRSEFVTVLRNGKVVQTTAAAGETKRSLVAAMLGAERELEAPTRKVISRDEPPMLDVRGLSREGAFAEVDLQIRAGEIVGLAGLVGSGRSELARAIAGADSHDSGEVYLDSERVRFRNAGASIRRGVVLLPEDRAAEGLLMHRSVAENVTLSHLSAFSRLGLMRTRRETRTVSGVLERVDVQPPRPRIAARTLSGGNQQKVLFGRCTLGGLRILLADEPTRGVDVGARPKIHELLVSAAANGAGILLISSDLEEVATLSSRVLVMRFGRITRELVGSEITARDVTFAVFGEGQAAHGPRRVADGSA